MEVEDDYLEDMEDMERMIAQKNAALVEKDAALVEKNAALVEKNAALIEKDAAIKAVIEKSIQLLITSGMSEQDARAEIGNQVK